MFLTKPRVNYDLNTINHDFTSDQVYTLDTVGIITLKGFLSPTTTSYVNNVIQDHLKTKTPTPSKFAFFTLDPIFMEIMSHPWIMNACRKVVGEQFRFDHVVGIEQPGMIKSNKTDQWVDQGYEQGNIHGGLHSSQGGCFYHGFGDKMFAGHMTFGICLSGQNKTTGGFCYIPGSHKQSNPSNGADIFKNILNKNYDSDCIIVPELNAGDAVFFSESLMHGTTPLIKPNQRRAIYYKYLPGFAVWRNYDEIKHYLSLAKTDIQRNLLRPPYVASINDQDGIMSDNYYKPKTL